MTSSLPKAPAGGLIVENESALTGNFESKCELFHLRYFEPEMLKLARVTRPRTSSLVLSREILSTRPLTLTERTSRKVI